MQLDYIEEPESSYGRRMKHLAVAIGLTVQLVGTSRPAPLPPTGPPVHDPEPARRRRAWPARLFRAVTGRPST
ncbi:hypothetical protein Acy02nite_50870 [Actinoplanes cyaneus]|uniref:Uncharacterized protein n=1 Tax=Actinoplanes cyaneus TaxID=52696 RepID=A0A919MDI9_9ACTN|nr:hypothetical protein Acy02nite_50870 [Actinoplanes cyaneus]